MLEKSLKLEGFCRFAYHDEGHYSDAIKNHPWETILTALTHAKGQYPDQKDLIQFYVDRHKVMGDEPLDTIIENGYDVDGCISDLQQLQKELAE